MREAFLLPRIDRDHEMPRKRSEQAARAEIKTLGIERGRPGRQLGSGGATDRRTENQPQRWCVLLRARWPGKTRTPNPSAIDPDRIWPVEVNRFFRRRVGCKRVGNRGQPRIKCTPRGTQWLFGLQDHGEFNEIEATDMDQCARTGLGGNLCRMREGVADLPERDGAKWRRQIEARGKWRPHAASGIARHLWLSDSYLQFDFTIT